MSVAERIQNHLPQIRIERRQTVNSEGNGEIIENFEVVYFENREAFGRKNKRNGKKRENRSLIVANPYKNCCKTLAKKYKLLYYFKRNYY